MIWLLLIIPIAWPLVAKKMWPHEITTGEMALNIFSVVIIITIGWFAGKYNATHDEEIMNSSILSKKREHGSYIVAYPCNCRSCGKNCTTCSTCTQHHYTVDWTAKTFFGGVTLDHEDWLSPAVYALPDPKQYKDCTIGEPAAVKNSFKNYIKGVPDSIFGFNEVLKEERSDVPEYPNIVNYYKINRIIPYKFIFDSKGINKELNEGLRELGTKKRLNIILVVTSESVLSVKRKFDAVWRDGKRNDIILFFKVDNGFITETETTLWVKNIGNEIFASELKDSFNGKAMGDVPSIILKMANESYKLPDTEVFEYLSDEVVPPNWVIVLLSIFSVIGSIGLSIYLANNEENNL